MSADRAEKYFSKGYVQAKTSEGIHDSRKMFFKSFSAVDFEDGKSAGKALVVRLQDSEKVVEMTVRLSVEMNQQGYSSVVQLKNRSGRELNVIEINPLIIDIDDSSRLSTGWNGKDLRYFFNGFHSWELSQSRSIAEGENQSHWLSALHNISSSETIVVGFVTMAKQLSTVTFIGRSKEKDRLAQMRTSSMGDLVPVKNGDVFMSEELLILTGHNGLRMLTQYAEVTARKMNAICAEEVPAGWCSWYFYYTQPDEQEVLENAQFVRNRFSEHTKWIQLDDGYQDAVGDWEPNGRFASGLDSLADNIHKLGFKAGVWVAPFIAAANSNLFKENPDWFVKNEDGTSLVVGENPLWLGKFYALDLTQAGVIEFIEKVFRKLKQAGFEYFKIDFLYHAALEGRRENKSMTRAQTIRRGLEAVRRAVGDSLILGCGAPLGPCVGITDAMRIGTDIATDWRYEWGGGVYECSINTMTRAFMHNVLWTNDADCIIVRQDDNALTLDEVRLWANIVAISGGVFMMSDRMMDVSEERLKILEKVLPVYPKGGSAIDSLRESNPHHFVLPIDSTVGQWIVVAVSNLTEKVIQTSAKLAEFGLRNNQAHHLFEFWNRTYEGLIEETLETKLEPHTSKLLLIKSEVDVPDLLSTSVHFTQGASELSNLEWNEEKGELSVKMKRSTRESESVFFVFGGRWEPLDATIDGESVKLKIDAPEIVSVNERFVEGKKIRVRFIRK